ncbi:MAG: tetratricopeptide repeat protein, partial [Gammaproteobacteria bacterium]|nr:tetratricopeptide repeat protein [Gammaproteobacteria bacterium]
MNGFWWFAAGLAALAIGLPWLVFRRSGVRMGVAPLLILACVPLVAGALYWQQRQPTWELLTSLPDGGRQQPDETAREVDELIAALAERLRQEPDSIEGWVLLGRSYMQTGRMPEAAAAFTQAYERTPNPPLSLKVELAETLALSEPASLNGLAGTLIEEVLSEDPDNRSALFFGGLKAMGAENAELARSRWERLLELNPPESIATIIRGRLAQLGGEIEIPGTTRPAVDGVQPKLSIDVRLGAAISPETVASKSALFVIARSPEGGPPVAVKRLPVSAIPGKLQLDNSNTMLPGRKLGDFPELDVVVRLSVTGQPIAAPGDIFGASR